MQNRLFFYVHINNPYHNLIIVFDVVLNWFILCHCWLTFLQLSHGNKLRLKTRDRLRRSTRAFLILRYSTLLQIRKRVDVTAISRITTKCLEYEWEADRLHNEMIERQTLYVESIFRLPLRPCNVRTCGAFALSQWVQTITASHSRTSRENPILGDVPSKKKNTTAFALNHRYLPSRMSGFSL